MFIINKKVNNMTINNRLSLEARYEHLTFQDVDFRKKCDFQDYYRKVNEWPPQNIKPHLSQTEPGAAVVTGTERGFFVLLSSDERLCEGLISRDINPKAKAYIDFNVLLLRISKNMQEYTELSEPVANWWDANADTLVDKRVAVIKEKTLNSDLPESVKNYYLKHMETLGSTYLWLGSNQDWRKDPHLSECWYHNNEERFLKLQRYAKSGNIIATIGDISDLKFLRDTKISVVDTSNIHDYCVVNLQGEGNFSPTVIWTELTVGETQYYSAPYTYYPPLSREEEAEFQKWIALFKETHPCIGENNGKHYFQILTKKLKLENSSLRNNPKLVLDKLKKYMQESVLTNPDLHILNDPTLGYVCLSNSNTINGLSAEHINILCRNPNIAQHVPFLVGKQHELKKEPYLAFMRIKGWKEEFERQCSQLTINLDHVLLMLGHENLQRELGSTRLAALKIRVSLSHLYASASSISSSIVKTCTIVAGIVLVGSYWAMNLASSQPSE
jgi:hypothetical protein